MMDVFEDIDENFGEQLGVGDIIKMHEKSPPHSNKRKKKKKSKFIVFEDEIDEDEYTYFNIEQIEQIDSLSDSNDPDYVHIAQEVSEATGNIFCNEPLEELSKEIASKCKLDSSKGNIKALVPSSANQKDAKFSNSLVSNDTPKKTSCTTSKASNLNGLKTVASSSLANSSKSPASKSESTEKKLAKSTPSSANSKETKSGKSTSKSRSKRKKTEVYVPGSSSYQYKHKDSDFPALR